MGHYHAKIVMSQFCRKYLQTFDIQYQHIGNMRICEFAHALYSFFSYIQFRWYFWTYGCKCHLIMLVKCLQVDPFRVNEEEKCNLIILVHTLYYEPGGVFVPQSF